jgi:succinate dehydrogenase / fumarate reductase flavoprotein subunit
VYLDVSHLPKDTLRKKLAGVLEIYEKFVGEDPYENPMRVFPAVHYSMGGLWVDFDRSLSGSLVVGSPRNHATNIAGLYAAGEVDYQYHGANRLGANSLLSCIYAGTVAGPAIATYIRNLNRSSYDMPASMLEKAEARERANYDAILKMDGTENPYQLHAELGEMMLVDCTIERDNSALDRVLAKIEELADRANNVGALDTSAHSNQAAQFTRHMFNMIALARVIAQGARNRDESRGSHFKRTHPDRNDAEWLRTTLAIHKAGAGNHHGIDYVRSLDYAIAGQRVHATDAVDTTLVRPRARKYDQAGAATT